MFNLKEWHSVVEESVNRLFERGQDRENSPIYVYFKPYGGYFRKYFIGSSHKNDIQQKGLTWQTPYLKNLSRTIYWLLNPIVCISLSFLIAAALNEFSFSDVSKLALHVVLVFLSLWLLSIPGYILGVYILTRGLRVEQNKPLTKETKEFLIKKMGMAEESVIRAELMQHRNAKLAFIETYKRMNPIPTWKIILLMCLAGFGTFNSFSDISALENLQMITAKQVLYFAASMFMNVLVIFVISLRVIQSKVK
jgi:hypothetical protein